jgi:hypothetical protein
MIDKIDKILVVTYNLTDDQLKSLYNMTIDSLMDCDRVEFTMLLPSFIAYIVEKTPLL